MRLKCAVKILHNANRIGTLAQAELFPLLGETVGYCRKYHMDICVSKRFSFFICLFCLVTPKNRVRVRLEQINYLDVKFNILPKCNVFDTVAFSHIHYHPVKSCQIISDHSLLCTLLQIYVLGGATFTPQNHDITSAQHGQECSIAVGGQPNMQMVLLWAQYRALKSFKLPW